MFACGGSLVYCNIIFITKIVVTCNLMRRKNVELWMPKSLLEVLVDVQLQVKVSEGGGGVLPHKRLKWGCVAGWGCIFSTGVTIMGSQIYGFWG